MCCLLEDGFGTREGEEAFPVTATAAHAFYEDAEISLFQFGVGEMFVHFVI
jgi:hypothetical protein